MLRMWNRQGWAVTSSASFPSSALPASNLFAATPRSRRWALHNTDALRAAVSSATGGSIKDAEAAGGESILSELTRAVVSDGAGTSVFAGVAEAFAPPPHVETRRDALRRLGLSVDRGETPRAEALADAASSLFDGHPLVRLASIHAVARIALRGDRVAWESISGHLEDADELVRVGAARAIGRIAAQADADALAILQRAQRETPDENLRLAARDAEARIRGIFAMPGDTPRSLLGEAPSARGGLEA